FDAVLRAALTDAAHAAHADPGLADTLVAAARPHRNHARRWTATATPLLAAAAVAALVAGVAAVSQVVAARHVKSPATHFLNSSPVPHAPTPHPSATHPSTPHPSPYRATSHSATHPAPHPATHPAPHPSTTPAVAGFHAASVSFSDPADGWALGDGACASGGRTNCPALLATSDGGASWHMLTVPTGLVSTLDFGSCGDNGNVHGPCVDSVSFANAYDGYLWSLHQLYWTTDGGHSWQRFADPQHDWTGATRLVFVGSRVVRLAPIHQCSSGCAGMVQSAPIGSTAFQPMAPGSQPVGLFSSNLVAANGAGYLFAGGTESNSSPGIFRTTDGAHWTPVARDACGQASGPMNDPFYAEASSAADNGALIANCLGSQIRVAAPGSAHFSAPRRLPRAQILKVEPARSQQQLVIADVSDASAPGPVRATFYVSRDGGRHWRRTATLPVGGAGIAFGSGGQGWALSADGTTRYVTTDGGATWRPTHFSS
ncbi:MAG TPA: hypothetical protein VIG48_05505, partial [Jatrophihabitans sp.]